MPVRISLTGMIAVAAPGVDAVRATSAAKAKAAAAVRIVICIWTLERALAAAWLVVSRRQTGLLTGTASFCYRDQPLAGQGQRCYRVRTLRDLFTFSIARRTATVSYWWRRSSAEGADR